MVIIHPKPSLTNSRFPLALEISLSGMVSVGSEWIRNRDRFGTTCPESLEKMGPGLAHSRLEQKETSEGAM